MLEEQAEAANAERSKAAQVNSEAHKLRDEQKDLTKQLYEVQKATEKIHLESETLKIKNSELMLAIEKVK